MVVPLLLAATINTLAPDLPRIGNVTQALFGDSAGALIALFLVTTAILLPLYIGFLVKRLEKNGKLESYTGKKAKTV